MVLQEKNKGKQLEKAASGAQRFARYTKTAELKTKKRSRYQAMEHNYENVTKYYKNHSFIDYNKANLYLISN